MFHAVRSVFGLLLLGAFMLAHAALPTGTLEYTQRLGVVGANESIELRLRFTLDPGSTPLSFNSDPLTGFAAADLPTTSPVYDPVTKTFVDVPIAPGSIHSATLVSFYVCDGSFSGRPNMSQYARRS